MRWKLVIVASLLAAILGTSATLGFIYWLLGPRPRLATTLLAPSGLAAAGALLLPLTSVTFASIFVYRHTSRRRPLQAMATALLAIILTLAAFIAAAAFLSRTLPPGDQLLAPANQRV